jgi:predicted Ser/Thr protein kinase
MKKRINWKAEAGKWQGHYDEWGGSELSQKEYCDANGVRFEAFKTRLQMMRNKGFMGPANRSGFFEVKITGVPEARTPEVYCEIRFGESGRIVIEKEGSLEKLRELVGALRL